MCLNETISGVEFIKEFSHYNSHFDGIPVIADATSTLFSRPIDIDKYSMIYASSGKNLGFAGMTLVIVKDDLISNGTRAKFLPSIMDYEQFRDSKPIQSLYNTPPTLNIYFLNRLLEF